MKQKFKYNVVYFNSDLNTIINDKPEQCTPEVVDEQTERINHRLQTNE